MSSLRRDFDQAKKDKADELEKERILSQLTERERRRYLMHLEKGDFDSDEDDDSSSDEEDEEGGLDGEEGEEGGDEDGELDDEDEEDDDLEDGDEEEDEVKAPVKKISAQEAKPSQVKTPPVAKSMPVAAPGTACYEVLIVSFSPTFISSCYHPASCCTRPCRCSHKALSGRPSETSIPKQADCARSESTNVIIRPRILCVSIVIGRPGAGVPNPAKKQPPPQKNVPPPRVCFSTDLF